MKNCLGKESEETSSGVQVPFTDIVTSVADSLTHLREVQIWHKWMREEIKMGGGGEECCPGFS